MSTLLPPPNPIDAAATGAGVVIVPSEVNDYWVDVLHRIGVVATREAHPCEASVAFIPPDSRVSNDELRQLHARGVALVGDGRVFEAFDPRGTRPVQVRGVLGTGGLFDGCATIRMPATIRTHRGELVQIDTSLGAPRIALPLPTAAAACRAEPAMHEFPVANACGVDEIVSGCDHGGLRRLVQNALRIGCQLGNRPFGRLGNAPEDHSGVLGIRIDADSFDAGATATVLDSLARADFRATWFIDVERHQRMGGAGAVRETAEHDHEVQSHFYHHYTYRSGVRNHRNLRRSRDVLSDWGVTTTAAAAPFGTFHGGVQSALEAESIEWSSEFSAIYDDEPSRLTGRDQVPVHPVCPILLLAAGLDAESVHKYYIERLRAGLGRGESVLFYGHPIRDLELVPDLFTALRREIDQHAEKTGQPVWQPTLSEFKQFHDQRRRQLETSALTNGAAPLIMELPERMSASSIPHSCEPWTPGAAPRLLRKQRNIRFRRWLREVRRR